MVKLRYNGSAATGLVVFPGGSISVVRGHIYDIDDENVESLLANGEWTIVKDIKVTKVKVKKFDDTRKIINEVA